VLERKKRPAVINTAGFFIMEELKINISYNTIIMKGTNNNNDKKQL
jgi:hypothetical protein